MKYRQNFGETPRHLQIKTKKKYSNSNLGSGLEVTKDDVKNSFKDAVSVNYDPKTGKITPKIDTKALQKSIVRTLTEKVKNEIINRIKEEVLQQMSAQVAAIYAQYIVPGMQVVATIKLAIQMDKITKQVMGLIFTIYGQKIFDALYKAFFGTLGQYRDANQTFENAARDIFSPPLPSENQKDFPVIIPAYIEEYKKFTQTKLKTIPGLIMLQFYPYYVGEKSRISIVNEIFPDLKKLDTTKRYNTARELALFLRNGVEELITTYLYSKERKLKDETIDISLSDEFQDAIDFYTPMYVGEDSDFFYDVSFYTTSTENVQPEFKDKIFTAKDFKVIYPNYPDLLSNKHTASFEFISLAHVPEKIKEFALKMKYNEMEDYKIIKKIGEEFVELPYKEYIRLDPDSFTRIVGKRFELDFNKIPTDVYIIRDKRIKEKAKDNKSFWIKYHADTWPLMNEAARQDKIIAMASMKLHEMAVDLAAKDPVEEYTKYQNALAELEKLKTNQEKHDNTITNAPIRKIGYSTDLTSKEITPTQENVDQLIKIDEETRNLMSRIAKNPDYIPYMAKLLKGMDSTTAEVFLKAVQIYPYPFNGISHSFYFNRINKIVEEEVSEIRKKNQRIGLGVAGLAVLGYLATQD